MHINPLNRNPGVFTGSRLHYKVVERHKGTGGFFFQGNQCCNVNLVIKPRAAAVKVVECVGGGQGGGGEMRRKESGLESVGEKGR